MNTRLIIEDVLSEGIEFDSFDSLLDALPFPAFHTRTSGFCAAWTGYPSSCTNSKFRQGPMWDRANPAKAEHPAACPVGHYGSRNRQGITIPSSRPRFGGEEWILWIRVGKIHLCSVIFPNLGVPGCRMPA